MKKILVLLLVLIGLVSCDQPTYPKGVYSTQSLALVAGVPTVAGHFTITTGSSNEVNIVVIAKKAGAEVARTYRTLSGSWANSTAYPYSVGLTTLSALSDLDEYSVSITAK